MSLEECQSAADSRIDLFIVYQLSDKPKQWLLVIEAFLTQKEAERKCAELIREGAMHIGWQRCTFYMEDQILLGLMNKCQKDLSRIGLKP